MVITARFTVVDDGPQPAGHGLPSTPGTRGHGGGNLTTTTNHFEAPGNLKKSPLSVVGVATRPFGRVLAQKIAQSQEFDLQKTIRRSNIQLYRIIHSIKVGRKEHKEASEATRHHVTNTPPRSRRRGHVHIDAELSNKSRGPRTKLSVMPRTRDSVKFYYAVSRR